MGFRNGFWVVWAVGGGKPTVRHHTEYLARQEAARLAAANPGNEFVVCRATHSFIANNVSETILE